MSSPAFPDDDDAYTVVHLLLDAGANRRACDGQELEGVRDIPAGYVVTLCKACQFVAIGINPPPLLHPLPSPLTDPS